MTPPAARRTTWIELLGHPDVVEGAVKRSAVGLMAFHGGLEAGMTNGQPLVIRAAKKPISTLRKPLESINLATKETEAASYERSDVCAVPAAGVIIENVVNDIDTIVRQVRFTGWTQTQNGDRTVRREIRLVLKKYGLPSTGELFDHAYAYIRENY